jgi:hypothetical protein
MKTMMFYILENRHLGFYFKTRSALKEDLPLIPFPFNAPSWKWDVSWKLWVGPGNVRLVSH